MLVVKLLSSQQRFTPFKKWNIHGEHQVQLKEHLLNNASLSFPSPDLPRLQRCKKHTPLTPARPQAPKHKCGIWFLLSLLQSIRLAIHIFYLETHLIAAQAASQDGGSHLDKRSHEDMQIHKILVGYMTLVLRNRYSKSPSPAHQCCVEFVLSSI